MNRPRKEKYVMAIDSGNTRVKWKAELVSGGEIRNFVALNDLVGIKKLWADLRRPDICLVSNVAGPRLKKTLLSNCFDLWGIEPIFIKSQRTCCGVTNNYNDPHSLGTDRWAALIGAHDLGLGDSLVITLGTASTVDVLYSDGGFMGGIIFPGLDLMMSSLSQKTFALPNSEGGVFNFPRKTDDAIFTGVIRATAGAIDAMRCQVISDRGMSPKLVISGGNAKKIATYCSGNRVVRDNLVIDGLLRIGRCVK